MRFAEEGPREALRVGRHGVRGPGRASTVTPSRPESSIALAAISAAPSAARSSVSDPLVHSGPREGARR